MRTGQGTVGYVNGNKDLDPGGVCGLCSRTARVALNPIVVADSRCRAGQGCADCVGEQYGTDGLTCQACEPGKHPHIDHTSCDDCSPVRPRQASAPDAGQRTSNSRAGWAGEGGRHGHVQEVQARQDAGGRQAVLHQVWRSVPQTHRARCAQRFCADRLRFVVGRGRAESVGEPGRFGVRGVRGRPEAERETDELHRGRPLRLVYQQ